MSFYLNKAEMAGLCFTSLIGGYVDLGLFTTKGANYNLKCKYD